MLQSFRDRPTLFKDATEKAIVEEFQKVEEIYQN